MTKWPLVPLSKLGKVVTGSTPSTSKSEFWDGEIPFVTPSELDQPYPILATPRNLTEAGAKEARLLPPCAVLVCCIGSLGKVGIAGRALVSNQQINSIIFDEDIVYPKYGYHACALLKSKLESMAPATTVAIVSKSKFEALEIPLPPLEEQKRIAAILDQADALRKARRRAIARLNDLSQSIFYEMFGDPATNPKEWLTGTIRDLAKEVKYGTSQKAHLEPEGLPILRMGNITYSGELELTDLKYIHLSEQDFEKYIAREGDLLFNRTNSKELVGKTTVFNLDEPYAIAGYLIRVKVNEHANPYYISGYLNSPHGKTTLQNMCKNIVGMANINAQELQDITIALPPIELQNRYAERIAEIKKNSGILEKHLDKLDTLFSSLQQRAFRGELGKANFAELVYNHG